MTTEQRDKIIKIMASYAHCHPDNFSIYIPFSGYQIDSLDFLSMIQSIEEYLNYKVEVNDHSLASLKNGNDVLNYLEGVI